MKRVTLHVGLGLGLIWNIFVTIMVWILFLGAVISTTVGATGELGIFLGLAVGIPAGALLGAISVWFFNLATAIVAYPVLAIGVLIYHFAPGSDPLKQQVELGV